MDGLQIAISGYVSPGQSLLDHLDLLSPPAWQAEARCRDGDPEAFFPDKGEPVSYATAICDTCPVQPECLDYAMEVEGGSGAGSRHGVWGGKSPVERARLARQTG